MGTEYTRAENPKNGVSLKCVCSQFTGVPTQYKEGAQGPRDRAADSTDKAPALPETTLEGDV